MIWKKEDLQISRIWAQGQVSSGIGQSSDVAIAGCQYNKKKDTYKEITPH